MSFERFRQRKLSASSVKKKKSNTKRCHFSLFIVLWSSFTLPEFLIITAKHICILIVDRKVLSPQRAFSCSLNLASLDYMFHLQTTKLCRCTFNETNMEHRLMINGGEMKERAYERPSCDFKKSNFACKRWSISQRRC